MSPIVQVIESFECATTKLVEAISASERCVDVGCNEGGGNWDRNASDGNDGDSRDDDGGDVEGDGNWAATIAAAAPSAKSEFATR